MTDLAITLAFLTVLALVFNLVFGIFPINRIARRACPECERQLGRASVATGVPYYERVYGAGMRVMDGPRRYMGARVIACQRCKAEFVFSELGSLVEPFVEDEVNRQARRGT